MNRTSGTAGRRPGSRLVIFNADDFGLTAATNAGIIGAHRRGPVRCASLMVTTPGFADAVALARDHPRLDLGVHLALTGVSPALPPAQIPSLVGRGGRFPRLGSWVGRALGGSLRPEEVRAELAAQLARALATGLRFTHLDGHHHVHVFPTVAPVVATLAREQGIPVVRRIAGRAGIREGGPKRRFLEGLDRRAGGAYDHARLSRADAFRGFVFPTSLVGWRDFIAALPPGVTETMCHPGLTDAGVRDLDPYVEAREVELRWLGDPRVGALLDEAAVVPTSFAEALATAETRR